LEGKRYEVQEEKKRQTILRSKNFLLFFTLPFIGIIVIFFVLSSLNRAYIKNKTEDLVKEQLEAAAEILKVNISHFLIENYSAGQIFESYAGKENIYYMALLNEKKEVLSWSSQFEGYLPLSLQSIKDEESWIIDSPAGKIFNYFSPFSVQEGKEYFLYLGYSLESLEEMVVYSRRNFFLIFGLISVIGIIFFLGIYQLQRHYLEKKREAEEEKKEKERYREISAFTSGVGHEIKNPLNSVSLIFELLEKKAPPDLQEEVGAGKEEIQKISRIIDQFASSLRPLKLSKETFALAEVVSSVRGSLMKESDKADVEIRYVESSSIALKADKDLLSQALSNLLRNSIEAGSGGLVSIEAQQKKKKVLIKIEDSGRGIAEKDEKHIFEPFFSRKKQGLGIGLYLTKKIVEAHEGKIEAQSKVGLGTTFLIEIPGG
jgi:signal transduction histidine kinase